MKIDDKTRRDGFSSTQSNCENAISNPWKESNVESSILAFIYNIYFSTLIMAEKYVQQSGEIIKNRVISNESIKCDQNSKMVID